MRDHIAEWVGRAVLRLLLVFGRIARVCGPDYVAAPLLYSKVHAWRLDLTGLVAIIKTNNLGRYYNGLLCCHSCH